MICDGSSVADTEKPERASLRVSRSVGVALAYLVAYVLFDWISFIDPFGRLNITPWNPPPGLSLALLMLCGLRWTPLLFVAAFSADVIVRHLAAPLLPTLITDVGEACIYAATAWLIRGPLRVSPDFRSFRDVLGVIVGTVLGASLMATAYVGSFVAAGQVSGSDAGSLIFEYWVGDSIGVLVIAPFLLIHRRHFGETISLKALFSWEVLGQAAALGLSLWLLFIPAWADGSHAFFVLFVPLVWVAAKRGLPGVTVFLLVTQLALVGGVMLLGWHGLAVIKLQFLMLTLAVTGLLLGVVISEREGAREAVVRGETRLRTIIDMAPDALIVTDESGCIDAANKVFERLSGCPREQAMGHPVSEFIVTPAPPALPQTILRHADGSSLPVEVSIAPLVLGGRHGSVVTARDISARKLIEERKHLRRSTLEQAARASFGENLAASLAHELNQPLSALIGYTAICQKLVDAIPAAPERLRQQMGKAVAQAERAGAIVSRLSEFFRSGRLETAPVPVRELIADVAGLFAEDAARIGARIDIDVADGLIARIDRLQVELALLNLLRNAIDALTDSPRRDRRISLSARPDGDQFVVIAVADNGQGIAEDIVPSLFDAFVTTRSDGTGLGLAITQSIVTSHGGRLWCDAATSEGARFFFTIPRAQETSSNAG